MVHTPQSTGYDYIDALCLSAHVPLFFLLSGYFTRKTDFPSACKRAVFLSIPFFLWNVLCWAIQLAQGHAGYEWGDVMSIIRGDADIPTWFLRNLIVYSVLMPLFRKRSVALIAACVFLVGALLHVRIGSFPFEGRLITGAGYFLLGFSLRETPLEQLRTCIFNKWKLWLSLGLVASIWAAASQLEAKWMISPLGCMGILAFCIAVDERFPSVSRLTARCGEATFLLFVIHYPCILLCGWYNSVFLPWWNYGYTVLFGLGCLALSTALLALLKQWLPGCLPYVAALKPKSASSRASVCRQEGNRTALARD